MTLSLNEIEATAKRATRGAGYPWGLAEEAAKATRWLCAQGVDGAAALAGLLDQVDGKPLASCAPDPHQDPWAASGALLCPLLTGAAISDRPHVIAEKSIRLENIAQPVMLMPFAALLAQQINAPVTVTWADAEATTDGTRFCMKGTAPAMSQLATVSAGGEIDHPADRCTRADPQADDLATLNRFAHRTYAPATEESRLKGAGSGLSDND